MLTTDVVGQTAPPAPQEDCAETPPLPASCIMQSERQKVRCDLNYPPRKGKGTRSRTHWNDGTWQTSTSSAKSCLETAPAALQEVYQEIIPTEADDYNDYFLISLPAMQSDFLEVGITIK